ncbi:MAG: dinitrogenase iron-molybdenum cofactor biosynthesis protein [Lachnospiraceae bacterium]|nr:dinitrogenase iron-molybdenum cofactor biosynthesis protein [Lachnospiraceae bacterium]
MDNIKYYVAVASSDKIVVNKHFGRADTFHIYGIAEDNSYKYIEKIELTPICEGGNHDENKLVKNAEELSMCRYVIVSRIGPGASSVLASKGITAMEIPDLIDNAINKVISYDEIQDLFK